MKNLAMVLLLRRSFVGDVEVQTGAFQNLRGQFRQDPDKLQYVAAKQQIRRHQVSNLYGRQIWTQLTLLPSKIKRLHYDTPQQS
jgi:hypothetical protein